MRMAKRKGLRGSIEARELRLFIDNDGDLYRQRYMPILRNQCKKAKSGKYDATKSAKGWQYLVDAGAKKYIKEFGGGAWHKIFDAATRRSVAREYASETRGVCREHGLASLRRRRRK